MTSRAAGKADRERASEPNDILASGNRGKITGKLLEGLQGDLDTLTSGRARILRHFLSYGVDCKRRRATPLHLFNDLLSKDYAYVGGEQRRNLRLGAIILVSERGLECGEVGREPLNHVQSGVERKDRDARARGKTF